jgi:diguanylate cyclase (GGDEF)-like protein
MAEPFATGEETKRLHALQSLKVLDAQPAVRFERITRLAQRVFDVPLAAVRLPAYDGVASAEHRALLEAIDQVLDRARHAGARSKTARDVVVVPDLRADSRFKQRMLRLDGRAVRFCAACAIHAPHGSRVGTLYVLDVVPRTLSVSDSQLFAELGGMASAELASLSIATSDPLTLLANRRGFEQIASHILPMAKRLILPVALVHIDLDGFKSINDNQGHAAGDRLLAQFARHLLKNFRESDVVARLGGDEFCVLMSGATEPAVLEALRRLQMRLEQCGPEPVRFSAGLAMFDPARHASVADLLRDADERMYSSKRGKRVTRRA